MEDKKEFDQGLLDYIECITRPIFKKFLSETDKNLTLVGSLVPNSIKVVYYNSHNYRLYIDFENPAKPNINQGLKLGFSYHKVINSKENIFFYNKFTIRVKSKSIEIINKVEPKRWYQLELSHKAKYQIADIIAKKDQESLDFLKLFIKAYGGKSNLTILNRHSDNKVMREDIIDKLPLSLTFQNKVVKKVYKENNIEFSNPAYASNYITNRSIEEIAPLIAEAIQTNTSLIDPLKLLKSRVKGIKDIIYHKALVMLLNENEKRELELWLMKTAS